MTFSCIVDAALFAQASAFVSTEETRYYLCGVQVEPCPSGGVILVSTDGHAMIVVRDPAGVCEGAAIVKLSKDTLKALPARRPFSNRYLVVDDNRAQVFNGDERRCAREPVHIQTAPALIDGTFPNWRRVVPEFDANHTSALQGCFDGRLVVRMAKALTPFRCAGVSFYGADETAPHLAFGESRQAFGVIMPLRKNIPAVSIGWALEQAPR